MIAPVTEATPERIKSARRTRSRATGVVGQFAFKLTHYRDRARVDKEKRG
jgi:hypothetical protein